MVCKVTSYVTGEETFFNCTSEKYIELYVKQCCAGMQESLTDYMPRITRTGIDQYDIALNDDTLHVENLHVLSTSVLRTKKEYQEEKEYTREEEY